MERPRPNLEEILGRSIDSDSLANNLRESVFVFIRGDQANALDACSFLRLGDRVTSGDDDQRIGMISNGIATHAAGCAGRFLRHRAGVDDNDIGIGTLGNDLEAKLHEVFSHLIGFGLIQPATEGAERDSPAVAR